MKIRLRKTLCLFTALLLAMSALGAEALAADFVPALDTNTACTIEVVGSYSNFESLEAEFEAFNRYYPYVELHYNKLDDYNNVLASTLAADRPNIYFSYRWMVSNDAYAPVLAAAEDLSDPALGIDLSGIRQELLYTDGEGRMPMAPVFATTYGMLVNERLFEQLDIPIPTRYSELLSACDVFRAAGYDTPVLGYFDKNNTMLYSLTYPWLCGIARNDPAALEALNSYAPEAGEYVRPVLELVKDFMDSGSVNLDSCLALEDNYSKMILRFFEGDIPMLFCNGDTVSGTAKRQEQSEAFRAQPFAYSFWPIPVTEEGGWFASQVSVALSVCADCDNLDMTNEFMRFLLSTPELNELARHKRLLTTSNDLSLDGIYAAFGRVDAEHSVYTEGIGLLDGAVVQLRRAAYAVATNVMSVDEAAASFGSIPE